MAPPSPRRSTLSRLLICAKGWGRRRGGQGWGGRLATYIRPKQWIICTSQFPQFWFIPLYHTHTSTWPFSFFIGSTRGGQTGWGGGWRACVWWWRGGCISAASAGQPAFIRMNQRGNKISPVTKQGYEIRVLIEFSSPGRGCGALNIIEFDRLMKRAPMLAPPPFSRDLEDAVHLSHTHACTSLFNMHVEPTPEPAGCRRARCLMPGAPWLCTVSCAASLYRYIC